MITLTEEEQQRLEHELEHSPPWWRAIWEYLLANYSWDRETDVITCDASGEVVTVSPLPAKTDDATSRDPTSVPKWLLLLREEIRKQDDERRKKNRSREHHS